MTSTKSFSQDLLHVEVHEDAEKVTLRFLGKSILKDPSQFLMPILMKTVADAGEASKRVVMDFCALAYMNSSTLTPVIRILERARVGQGRITVSYRKSLKWQDLSFSALGIFQTEDKRIEISGTE